MMKTINFFSFEMSVGNGRAVLLVLLLTLYSLAVSAQVVINEWSAANFSEELDNFSEFEDWVELYNAGSLDVDLSGYYLSDHLDNPARWQFPQGTTIGAESFLIIWCSRRDVVIGQNYHSNFKLSQTKGTEHLVFSDPLGNVLESIALNKPNQTDHSWARLSDGLNEWGVALSPSPGQSNSGVQSAYCSTPILSPEAGWYENSVTVEIADSDPVTSIYYTTNGAIPTTNDILYTIPFTISATTVIRARAFSIDENAPDSFIETNTYFLGPPHTGRVVSIAGDQVDNLLEGNTGLEPIGSFEYFNKEGVFIDESVGQFDEHGNDSNAYDQRGIDYRSRDQFGYNHAISEPIFEMKDRPTFERLILDAASSDNYPFENGGAHIRDAFVQTLSHVADLELDERTYEPCALYVNGVYWGAYELREKVDDHDFTSYYYNQSEIDIDFLKRWGGVWADYGNFSQWNALENYILTNDMSVQANFDYVNDQYNVMSLIDYTILNTFVVNSDWLNWNTAWWRGYNPDGTMNKWRFALWDLDATFDHYVNFTGIPDNSPNAAPCSYESAGVMSSDLDNHMAILSALLENEEVADLYVNRFADLNNTFFQCDYLHNLLNQLVDTIEPEMHRHCDRWGGSVNGWLNNVQGIHDFIQQRCAVIDAGIVDCYDVDGPFALTIGLAESGSAVVHLNTLTLEEFPWTGDYFNGAPIQLVAEPKPGFVFSHWEVNQGGEITNWAIPVTLNMSVITSAIAYLQPAGLTYMLEIEEFEAGSIFVNNELVTENPFAFYANEGDLIELKAVALEQSSFAYWTSTLFDPSQDLSATELSFVASESAAIQATFNPVVGITNGGPNLVHNFRVKQISPIPAFDEIRVQYSGFTEKEMTVSFYDLLGRVVYSKKITVDPTVSEITIPINPLPAGTFILSLSGVNVSVNERFVKN